ADRSRSATRMGRQHANVGRCAVRGATDRQRAARRQWAATGNLLADTQSQPGAGRISSFLLVQNPAHTEKPVCGVFVRPVLGCLPRRGRAFKSSLPPAAWYFCTYNITRVTRWWGLGRLCLPKIFFFLVTTAALPP